MEVVLHDTGPAGTARWSELALPVLESEPRRNTIALTYVGELGRTDEAAALLLTAHDGAGEVTGAAVRSPGHGLLVSALPPVCAPAVVDALAGEAHDELWRSGISGSVREVEAIAQARVAATGDQLLRGFDLRLWALTALVAPAGVPGGPRSARPAEGRLLADWYRGFGADVAAEHPGRDRPGHEPSADESDEELAASVSRDLALGRDLVLWEVHDRPVALAVAHTQVAGSVRIGPVYTPPQHRGHGYASAVTAAAAARALAAGARHVVLFTDADADVPNRIYARIGFERFSDACEVRFTAGSGGG